MAARWIGWKALACNISDVAAMGGTPSYAVVSLGLPPRTPVRVLDGLAEGLRSCAKRFGVTIVGGDTVRAPRMVVDVAMVGTVSAGRPVVRSGAQVGDRIFVTGQVGGSLRRHRHATFLPRLREVQWLVKHLSIHAMIDLSDGLAADLWQVARASRATLRVEERAVPIAPGAQTVWHALMDGEDFELLFVVSRRTATKVPPSIGGCRISQIGTVTGRAARVELVRRDGRVTPLTPKGFRHFG